MAASGSSISPRRQTRFQLFRYLHRLTKIAGMDSPTSPAKVRLVMGGIRRTKGTAQTAKTPVLVEDLRRMIARSPEGLLGRSRPVLFLIGFCEAFRRTELVALDRGDVEFTR